MRVMATQRMYGPYPAAVLKVYDGDTMTLQVDLGFNVGIKMRCRIWGINAPEMKTDEGVAAQAYAAEICPVGGVVTVMSHGWDKYARFDGQVTLPDGRDFGPAMIEAGHAVEYKA